MIIGHLLPLEAISTIDAKRLDELTKIAFDALIENPIIDDQIRQNPIIMKELTATVTRALKESERKK